MFLKNIFYKHAIKFFGTGIRQNFVPDMLVKFESALEALMDVQEWDFQAIRNCSVSEISYGTRKATF